MATVAAGLVIDLNDSDDGTTALGFRRALAALFRQESPGVAQPGRLGVDHFVVSGSGYGMEYSVSGGGIVLVRGSTGGVYLVGVPGSTMVATPPSDGVNPRIDRIYALQPDPVLDGSGVDVDFVIDVAVGVPAASPVAPSIPPGAFELARKVIAPGVTNTQYGAGFTNIAPTTGLNLGVGASAPHFRLVRKAPFDFTADDVALQWGAIPAEGQLVGFMTSDYRVFTCTRAGVYLINAHVSASGSSPARVKIRRNGIVVATSLGANSLGSGVTTQICKSVVFAVGDTMEIVLQSNTTFAGIPSAEYTSVSVDLLGGGTL